MAQLGNPTMKVPIVTPEGTLTFNGLRLMQGIVNALNGSSGDEIQKITLGNGLNLYVGTGSPNGKVIESPPAVYFNKSGGSATTLFVKESGVNTDTGWAGK